MTLFKLALKNLKHDVVMNVLTVLQMAVAFMILNCMISTIVSRFRLYDPLKEFFNDRTYYYSYNFASDPETLAPYNFSSDIADLIEGESGVYAEYVMLQDGSNHYVSFDDKLLEIYTPELESGEWFDLDNEPAETVQIVISETDNRHKVGDIFTVTVSDVELKVEVKGILKNRTPVLCSKNSFDGTLDHRDLYTNIDPKFDESDLYIFRQAELADKGYITVVNGNVFVTYPNDASPQQISENNDIMLKINRVNKSSGGLQLKKNSLKYIFSQLYDLLPIFVCVLILTLVGAVSTSALSAKRQLKNYAVYYICGLKWKQCARVNFWSSFICVMTSFALSLGLTLTAKAKGLLGNTVIETGAWQLLGCGLLIVIYMLLSLILPLSIIGRNTPNQVLKTN